MTFTNEQLELIGVLVDGMFSHEEEGDLLIYGSNYFPSHRIIVHKLSADRFLEKMAQEYRDELRGD